MEISLNTKEEEQIMCFNWRNLQPLWRKENLEKRDSLDYQSNISVPWGDPNLSLEERKCALRSAIYSNTTPFIKVA